MTAKITYTKCGHTADHLSGWSDTSRDEKCPACIRASAGKSADKAVPAQRDSRTYRQLRWGPRKCDCPSAACGAPCECC
jgi:hypothetical protein